ncbi:SusC/RagA family TonB-linked outer membrane protein [Pedobacter sp. N36a]|uniref:SusC/RagA family TonB-linked outer membrane protein n=1 Tax=Pedobacter sp. N36a TaxID=2767996 RepID=UPI001994AA89|nr:SusC/RagA family TonB-linked outer membrane protein [Pedobacter sp. N36a]MBC8986541.1 SusC/RagA family TonB-linked outer membrane protein [Pedobacter sp. N36a]
MKLITAILILSLTQVTAATFAQKITINKTNATIETVLEEIGRQSGYDVFVGVKTLNSAKSVSINVKNAAVEEVLRLCLEGQQLDFSIENKIIVIKLKQPSILDKVAAVFSGNEVFGIVLDNDNNLLPGATVTIKGSNRSTTTNGMGQFKLKDVPEGAILQISYMGYTTKELKINDNLLGIKLELSNSKLDEVQVMAYGKTNRRISTGNIVTITAKELEKQPVTNPLLALSGRVPGMIVTQTNGYAASPVKVEIRGRKAIDSRFVSDPLYIIDGVPLSNTELSPGSSYGNGSAGVVQNGFSVTGGQSPLFNLSTSNIESIEVLKDGDATAIYGSRGANGVILITTKKGKPGATSLSVNASQGLSYVKQRYNMLNTEQYLQLRRDAFANDNIVPTIANAPDLMLYDPTRYTDWQKKLWGNFGKKTDAALSLSGGDQQTQFLLTGNYGRTEEVLSNGGDNQNASMGFNLNHSALEQKFRISANVLYSYSAVKTISSPSVVTVAPNAPDIYAEDGSLNYRGWGRSESGGSYFPFGGLESSYFSNTQLIKGGLNLRYQLASNLSLSTNLGYNFTYNSNRWYTPVSSQDPENSPTGTAFSGSTNNANWIVEPQLNYNVNLFGGEFSVLLGASLQKDGTKTSGIYGLNYETDDFLEAIALAPVKLIYDNQGYYKYAALFGRLSYNLKDKYILNINGRRDGSSRFGPGKQFGNFGSIGAAWILSKENWMKDQLPAMVSFVKLRGSYGLTGSDAVGDYKYLTQWASSESDAVPLPDYNGVTPLVSLLAVNPDYRWQVAKKLEVALNLGFWDDRVNLQISRYRERIGNQLTEFPTPLYSGFKSVVANWPALLENKGWEFSVDIEAVKTDDIKWNLNFNGGRNTNILSSYPGIELSPYANSLKVGGSLNALYLLHYTGIDPQTGKYTFEDYNKDGKIYVDNIGAPGTGIDDRYINIDLTPKFSGGFGTSFNYKNFNVSAFFEYRQQIGINPDYNSSSLLGSMNNQSADVFGNYWMNPGDQALYARPSTQVDANTTYFFLSDGQYQDASFLRMNNLSFGYQFNEKISKKMGAKSFNLYANAQNIFVLSKGRGLDPSAQNFGAIPPPKAVVIGISAQF